MVVSLLASTHIQSDAPTERRLLQESQVTRYSCHNTTNYIMHNRNTQLESSDLEKIVQKTTKYTVLGEFLKLSLNIILVSRLYKRHTVVVIS